MSEYAALHATSLLLVGRKVELTPLSTTTATATSTSTTKTTTDDVSSKRFDRVPSDERRLDYNKNKTQPKNISVISSIFSSNSTGFETIMAQNNQHQITVVDDLSVGPDESRWRVYGIARRRKILEDDKRNGGRDFSLSFDCSVQRYFSVAHWYVEKKKKKKQ